MNESILRTLESTALHVSDLLLCPSLLVLKYYIQNPNQLFIFGSNGKIVQLKNINEVFQYTSLGNTLLFYIRIFCK